jgi:putative membrane protein
MALMMVVGVLLVVLVVFALLRGAAPGPRSEERLTAEEILAQRLARGEIDEADYQRRRRALQSKDGPSAV